MSGAPRRAQRHRRLAGILLLLLLTALSPVSHAATPDFLVTLQAAQRDAAPRLASSPFGRPLLLDSREADGAVEGRVLARLPVDFRRIRATLGEVGQWCEPLLLLPNVAGCRSRNGSLALALVNRVDAPLEDARWIEFEFRRREREGGLQLQLSAAEGPVGTRDYHIVLAAMPVAPGESFLELRYRYRFGLAARLAMQAYLLTAGKGKVGFTPVRGRDGTLRPVEGLRGGVERNVMRCYLALDAVLAAADLPPAARFERALGLWLAASAGYPAQLAEDDPEAYRRAKRAAWARATQDVPVRPSPVPLSAPAAPGATPPIFTTA